MFALVLWSNCRTRSVVKERDLVPVVSEGQFTSVRYKDGETYEAKVVKKSHDKDYLDKLKIDSEGNVMVTAKKTARSSALNAQAELIKEKFKKQKMERSNTVTSENFKLAKSASIFERKRRLDEGQSHEETFKKLRREEQKGCDVKKKCDKERRVEEKNRREEGNLAAQKSKQKDLGTQQMKKKKGQEEEREVEAWKNEKQRRREEERELEAGKIEEERQREKEKEREKIELATRNSEDGSSSEESDLGNSESGGDASESEDERRREEEDEDEELEARKRKESSSSEESDLGNGENGGVASESEDERRREEEDEDEILEARKRKESNSSEESNLGYGKNGTDASESEEERQQLTGGKRRREVERRRGVESRRELERQREIERRQEAEREREIERQRDAERQHEDREVRNRPGVSNGVLDEDPLVVCRSPGNGRVQICSDFNVWIDKGFLTVMNRWSSDAKQMTRRLLKKLVGEENLKNMCAQGRSATGKPGIPEDIVSAVEYYVNKKCPSGLEPSKFTAVINLMIGTLRHPRT
ncbi:hypothetical protein TKK_0015803 [Trichogramma kaykai]|uniref:BEN domain-containing protein n=1 Tax=Trichogramma kaykai TaxID=54128 RepID=A0ABD2W8H6_9HYME